MNDIDQALTRLFDRHRIVFWYDAKQELRAEFDALALPGVEKIVLDNNEFGVKYRILREQPDSKFLLYRAGPPPADLDNWLLDVQLAHGEFRADQIALWLTELGLGLEFTRCGRAARRVLPAPAEREDAQEAAASRRHRRPDIRLKMLAVCAGASRAWTRSWRACWRSWPTAGTRRCS